ncbi:DUF732 domain-containing protein [Mycolicibacter arupensis]|jgi:hypothetical protein|uniref:DUF732 domain-containing protein n=1 Tax=Mycolicibacter arupensis TaxID=342002 RepID=A0A0F5N0U2_9MYCO|nr:DUF732 domain-containing protein [Mycolicibacter arupensis]TXH15310.1 MAG: DUF732 domain-containing protein [Mycobacterium sp.]KAA1428578.1 DUF732 domain-containing protein [Mycolicibacter arupensis]KKB99872.1 hypothetical protein WR43_07780 [Mycolicibacter arupensis]MCV7277175.1 DUF732 domain-containing protein [Mycolicibacter arupensis]OQZ96882.1 hypothetical protein BST15_11455 [Mycolicibacter arupensis]
MKSVLLLAGVAAVVGLAAPAYAEPLGTDAAFLTQLTGAGLSHKGSDEVAISAGHSVCQLMDAGLSPMDTVVAVQTTNPGFTLQRAAEFARIAAQNYCPEYA